MVTGSRRAVLFSVAVQIVWSAPLALFFGYKWLARDEADASWECRTRNSYDATCYSGETTNMVLTLVFGGIAVLAVVILLVLLVRGDRTPVRTVEQRRAIAAEQLQNLDMLRAAGAISHDDYLRKRWEITSAL